MSIDEDSRDILTSIGTHITGMYVEDATRSEKAIAEILIAQGILYIDLNEFDEPEYKLIRRP